MQAEGGGTLCIWTAGPQAWASTPTGIGHRGAVTLARWVSQGLRLQTGAAEAGGPAAGGDPDLCQERLCERHKKRSRDGDSEAGNHLLSVAPG